MSKRDIIEAANAIHKEPLAKLKADTLNNASGTNHRALMQYNAMLDNITMGAGTITTIDCAGIDWKLRILTSDEYIAIRLDVVKIAKEKECFDDWYLYYLEALKTLTMACTPSPFKTEGETLFVEEDLKLLAYDILIELFKRYVFFVHMATKKAEEFSEEELQALMSIVRKKPEVLMELDRRQSVYLNRYLLSYCVNLEKMLKPEQTS